jgi:hypothetical protein
MPSILAPRARRRHVVDVGQPTARPLPDVYHLDAALVFAVPLGLFAWMAGNVVLRRPREPEHGARGTIKDFGLADILQLIGIREPGI